MICSQSVSNQSSNLAVHIRVCHMGKKDYRCTIEDCCEAFGYRHTRDNHEKSCKHCHSEVITKDTKFIISCAFQFFLWKRKLY